MSYDSKLREPTQSANRVTEVVPYAGVPSKTRVSTRDTSTKILVTLATIVADAMKNNAKMAAMKDEEVSMAAETACAPLPDAVVMDAMKTYYYPWRRRKTLRHGLLGD